ncbi:MAG: hypothetical protein BEN19_08755 [Epulopiscium sp. Nuni2H_MBin003]|nr:MAG: hypothetical protein BEN19_08755 [Epulopiscium sp. Nuni2H_MBin003]
MGQNILKGAMILAIASGLSKIIGMLYRIPITNIIGDQGNAIYSSAYNIYVLILTLSAVGIPSAISKLVAERRAVGAHKEAHKLYKIAMLYTTSVSIILASLLWFFSYAIADYMQNTDLTMPLRVLAPTCIVVTVMAVTRGYLQGMQDMVPTAVSQVVEQVFNGIFSIVLAYIFIEHGIVAASTGSTMGTGIGAVAGLIVIGIFYFRIKPKMAIRKSNPSCFKNETKSDVLKAILNTILPVILGSSIFAIITNIDTLMLNMYLPDLVTSLMEEGRYDLINVTDAQNLSSKEIANSLTGQYLGKYLTLINVPVSIILTLAMAATPAISNLMAKQHYAAVRNKIRMILKVGMLLAMPATIGLAIFAEPIIQLLYKNSPDGYRLLLYGSISIVFIAVAQLTTGVLQGMGKQYITARNSLIACIIKIFFNFIFLHYKEVNIYAVVHSTTICYIIFSGLNLAYLKRNLELKLNINLIIIRPFICAIIMGALSFGVYKLLYNIIGEVSLLIAIIFAIIVYFFIGILNGVITAKDLENIPAGKKLVPFVKRIQAK